LWAGLPGLRQLISHWWGLARCDKPGARRYVLSVSIGARLSQPQQPRTQLERTSSGNLKIPEY